MEKKKPKRVFLKSYLVIIIKEKLLINTFFNIIINKSHVLDP